MIENVLISSAAVAALLWAAQRYAGFFAGPERSAGGSSLAAIYAGAVFGAAPTIALVIGASDAAISPALAAISILLSAIGGVCSLQIIRRYGDAAIVIIVAGLVYSIFAIASLFNLAVADDIAGSLPRTMPVILLIAPIASLVLHFMMFNARSGFLPALTPIALGLFFGAPAATNPLHLASQQGAGDGARMLILLSAAVIFGISLIRKPASGAVGAEERTASPDANRLGFLPPEIAAVLLDTEGRCIAATPQAQALLGEELEVAPALAQLALTEGDATSGMRSFVDQAGVKHCARFYVKESDNGGGKETLVMIEMIDDLIASQEALEASDARLNAIFASNDDLLFLTTGAGQVVEVNRAALRFLKKSRNDCLGEYFWRLFPPSKSSQPAAAWRGLFDAATQDNTVKCEAQLAGGDGDRLFQISFTRTAADDRAEILLRGHDITDMTRMRLSFQEAQRRLEQTIAQRTQELRAAKRTADEANLSKSRFLANMSHELRTPLNAILGYSDLMSQDLEDAGQTDSQSYQDLARISVNGKHLLALINDVLDLAKVEANRVELAYEDVALSDFLAEIKASVDPLAAKRSNRFCIHEDKSLESISIDRKKVKQCLLNLISNAAKFTDAGDIVLTIASTTQRAGRIITFEVKDTGRGMSAEQCAAVFEEFVQAEGGDYLEAAGTGLGLPIAKRLAKLMGGDLTATSAPAAGSVFTLSVRDGPAASSGQEEAAA